MFVPFVFDMFTYRKGFFLWWFYKGLDFVKKTNSALIARELYINTSVSDFAGMGRSEAFDSVASREYFLYSLPDDQDLQSERLYRIPETLVNELIAEKGSITDAWCYLLAAADERLCSCIETLIDKIEVDCGEKIEGFISFQGQILSLDTVANRRNIPVIHWELGCWRHPIYLNTAFWDLEDLYGGNSVEQRWNRFQKERETNEVQIFSKKEILALLLNKEYFYLIEEYDRKASRTAGVALTSAFVELLSGKTYMGDMELLYRVRERYGIENMLIRKHPGDFYGGQYPVYAEAIERKQRNTPEFIQHCDTVISLMSGTCMEAMLFGRKAITLFPCPSYFASGHSIEAEGVCADDDFLSYFAFCYLIPLEYMTDVDYLRWRLTAPSEREIYEKHLTFYFGKKGLPLRLIQKAAGERLVPMLALQYPPQAVFPFDQIKAGEKIIIYGAGGMGRGFFRQVHCTKYCTILFFVDQNAEQISLPDVEVKGPESLRGYDGYDHIVVSPLDERVQHEIVRALEDNYNVPKEKIVIPTREI